MSRHGNVKWKMASDVLLREGLRELGDPYYNSAERAFCNFLNGGDDLDGEIEEDPDFLTPEEARMEEIDMTVETAEWEETRLGPISEPEHSGTIRALNSQCHTGRCDGCEFFAECNDPNVEI